MHFFSKATRWWGSIASLITIHARIKEKNIERLRDYSSFAFSEGDLALVDLEPLLEGTARVFHQAAQAGVRASWGQGFRHLYA